MFILGGVYLEACITPARVALLGSGGRAAMSLIGLRDKIVLHTFHPEELKDDVLVNLEPLGIAVTVHPAPNRLSFEYLHPLAAPRIVPLPRTKAFPVSIDAEEVLRFGCLEGDFVVTAKRAVYDPQAGNTPAGFGENGSTAGSLALVLNADEIRRLARTDDIGDAAENLISRDNTEAIVVKDGTSGAYVFDRHAVPRHVPSYPTRSVYKIGSGDVFSATFAHAWLSGRASAGEAADLASRRTADYVEAPAFPLAATSRGRSPAPLGAGRRKVLITAPGAGTTKRWLREQAVRGLESLGATAVIAGALRRNAAASAASEDCDVVLALLSDASRAMLELRDALARAKPVVAFADSPDILDEVHKTGVLVTNDLCSALYLTQWVPT